MRFYHSGKIGDLIFSLPTIQAIGGGELFIPNKAPECDRLYEQTQTLLEKQPYITSVRLLNLYDEGYNLKDMSEIINLNKHRMHPTRGATNMVQRYFEVFGIQQKTPLKWLHVDPLPNLRAYNLVNITPRFRGRVNWRKALINVSNIVFVGTDEEDRDFQRWSIPYTRIICGDVLQVARLVAGADAVWCNQSCVLALATALDKKRYVEFKPMKTNCYFYTPNEHELTTK